MASNSNFLFFLFFQANLEPKLTETMGLGNQLVVAEIVLVGLTSSLEMQLVLILVFSVFYVIGILGNLLIVITVISDSHLLLHLSRYFLKFKNICIYGLFFLHLFVEVRIMWWRKKTARKLRNLYPGASYFIK